MRSKSKRLMTALMAVVMLLSVMTPISAFAADVTMDLSKAEVSWDYTLTDADGNAFTAAYGLTAANKNSIPLMKSCFAIPGWNFQTYTPI